jgi:uncharacterized OB-fold protein
VTARLPALGAGGWFTEQDGAALLGSRCAACGTISFPPQRGYCPNPACSGREFEAARLPPTGSVWSFTRIDFQPPPPYIPRDDPFRPFVLLAVEVDDCGIVVLGQAADGAGTDWAVGSRVRLVTGTLYNEEGTDYIMWKWAPAGGSDE